jgi:hypothetical protein
MESEINEWASLIIPIPVYPILHSCIRETHTDELQNKQFLAIINYISNELEFRKAAQFWGEPTKSNACIASEIHDTFGVISYLADDILDFMIRLIGQHGLPIDDETLNDILDVLNILKINK